MLRDIQTYIADRGTVTVTDLSLHFHTSIDALQPMLNKLSRKARIRQLPSPTKCSGCTACDHHELICYEWVGPERSTAQLAHCDSMVTPQFKLS